MVIRRAVARFIEFSLYDKLLQLMRKFLWAVLIALFVFAAFNDMNNKRLLFIFIGFVRKRVI